MPRSVGVGRQRERQAQQLDEEVDGVEPGGGVPRFQHPVEQRAAALGGIGAGDGGEEEEERLGVGAEHGEEERAVEGEAEGIQRRQRAEQHRRQVRRQRKGRQRRVQAAGARREEAAHEERQLGAHRLRLAGGEQRAQNLPAEELALRAQRQQRARQHVRAEQKQQLRGKVETGKPRGAGGRDRKRGGKAVPP